MTRVLVAEDEAIVAMQLEVCIRSLGQELVGSASCGLEALDLAERLRPDIILMDIKMPGPMDGIEAARQIRTRFQIPVVFLTAYAEDPQIERAKQVEPLGFLVKPFDTVEIRAAIEVAVARMELERRLLDRDRRYQLASHAGRVGIWEWLPSTDRVYLEPFLCDLLGCPPQPDGWSFDEWLGWVHEDERAPIAAQFRSLLIGEAGGLELERRLLHRDGRVFWFLTRAQVIDGDDPQRRRVIAAEVDITERKRMEIGLSKSKERFRSLLETTSDLIWELDRDYRFVYLSPQIQRMLGYGPAELTDRSLFRLVPRGQIAWLRRHFTRMAAPGREPQRFETIFQHRNGTPVVVETSGVGFHDGAGRLLGFRGISRDVSERKRLQRDLENAKLRLERKVEERTRHLLETARTLKLQRRELQRRSAEVAAANESLREAYTAMIELNKSVERSREAHERHLALLLQSRMLPLLQRIQAAPLEPTVRAQVKSLAGYLGGLKAGLSAAAEIAGRLSETEWNVALLIREGCASREIAARLGLSVETVKTHRRNIRRKLELNHSGINLASHLITRLGRGVETDQAPSAADRVAGGRGEELRR